MTFEQSLAFGKTGESAIAEFMKGRGFNVLPVYEKTDKEYKGPAIYMTDGSQLIAPDMLIFGKKTFWIEAKHKSAFTWHRLSNEWVTGIDAHHYAQYLLVAKNSDWPVWLLFLHNKGIAKDTPPEKISPTGLFGEELLKLSENIHHTHKNWGNHGMVYWAHSDLKLIASLDAL